MAKCKAKTANGKQCKNEAIDGKDYCHIKAHREQIEKGGRPTDYKEEYAKQAYKLCLLGATDKEMADFFEVTERTINNWKKDFPEFFQSIKKGKKFADANVAESLYKRAVGYEHTDTKFATYEGQITDSLEYTKHYAPDTTAAFIWLKNRQPHIWRDKHEVEHSGEMGVKIIDDIE